MRAPSQLADGCSASHARSRATWRAMRCTRPSPIVDWRRRLRRETFEISLPQFVGHRLRRLADLVELSVGERNRQRHECAGWGYHLKFSPQTWETKMADQGKGPPYKSAHDVPRGRPTPTQDELDRLARGELVELAPDGTPPEPPVGKRAGR
jgi:hypothetical protein